MANLKASNSACCSDESDFDSVELGPQHEMLVTANNNKTHSSCSDDDELQICEQHTSPLLVSGQPRPLSRTLALAAIAAALVAVLLVVGHSNHAQLRQVEHERQALLATQQRLLLQLAKDKRIPLSKGGDDLVKHIESLQQQLESTSGALQEEKAKLSSAKNQATEAWEEVTHLTTELSQAEAQMQLDQASMYHSLALQQYGPGPHKAEFQVRIWKEDQVVQRSFQIEFAPLDYMPATVFLLLRQIDQGLWDNTSFHINAPHALLAHPVSASSVTTSHKEEMEAQGLARLPFAEYSERYPHKAYTLGLGGRVLPGPNFFINKLDNTQNHKDQPCFATVVQGRETIDLMGQLLGQEGGDPYYIAPVEITTVRLLR